MLTRTKIRSMTHASFYARGYDLFMRNKVKKLYEQESSFVRKVTAQVEGSGTKMYKVSFRFDAAKEEISACACDCPAYRSYDGLCIHLVAALLKYIDRLTAETYGLGNAAFHELYGQEADTAASEAGRSFEFRNSRMTTASVKQLLDSRIMKKTVPLLETAYGNVRIEPLLTLSEDKVEAEFRVGIDHMYVIKDVLEFCSRIRKGELFTYGKQLAFTHIPEAFAPNSRGLVRYLLDWSERYRNSDMRNLYYSYGYSLSNRLNVSAKLRTIPLEGAELESFLDVCQDCPIEVMQDAQSRRCLQTQGPPPRVMNVIGEEDGVRLFVSQPHGYVGRTEHVYFLDGLIYRQKSTQLSGVEEFMEAAETLENGTAFIQKEDVPAFCRDFLPDLKKHYTYSETNFSVQDYHIYPAVFEIYLDAPQENMISCRVIAVYGEKKYNVFGDKQELGQRDLLREVPVGRAVSAYCNAYDENAMAMVLADDEERMYTLLTEGIAAFQELGTVFISDTLKRLNVRESPGISVGISLSGDLLNLQMTAEGMSKEELLEILNKYDRKKKYYRLKNGDFINVADDNLETLYDLKQSLGLTEKQLAQEEIKLPKYRAMLLDESLHGRDHFFVEKDRDFRALVRNMKTVEDNDFEVPESLTSVLREYQKKGFLWLKTLHYNGFGGILADDMGLGKTLQVIAFLVSEYDKSTAEECGGGASEQKKGDKTAQEQKRCLIVTPASLVYNWYSEIQRFAPDLPAVMILGTAGERKALIENVAERQILITSYDLLKRDLEHYQDLEFFCQIIDEAQFIKNHSTQTAKAVKEIRAGSRFALTGTPVENRLSELWSIFDYLMPGFLYSYQRFRGEMESPVVQEQDEKVMERLQRIIRPFVLRRLKKDVLQDLPEKLEEEMYVRMEEEQQTIYTAHVTRLAMLLDKQSEQEFRTGKIQILAELTKLRQLCCDPALIYEGYHGGSAKQEMCLELIRNAVSNGHKLLLFSQFTSMLDILCAQLEREGIPFYTLTGSTDKETRKELVDKFQEDDVPVFCISLKAGGTGLNLTAADIVIHYDPWWNLAVQNQATDRAHRIGQKNAVTVYKLVTKDSVEENILRLQERKKELAEQVLGGEGIGSGSFTKDELREIIGVLR